MIQPLGKRILVQPIIPEKKSSILFLKDDTPQSFEILAIGDEVKKVAVGDVVFIATYSTSELKYNDQIHTLTSEDNVIAKLGK
jgi:co-chaperonin GroES (HSP10)